MSDTETAEAEMLPTTTRQHQVSAAQPEMNFASLMALSGALVQTGFLPKAIKTPAQAVAVILTGRELGIGTMQALRQVNIIEGKPSLSAELMGALILRAGHRIDWVSSTDEAASVKITRSTGESFTGSFTMEEAKRIKTKEKDQWITLNEKWVWKAYPKALLRARALSLTARAICPDAIMGVYTPEELGAEVDEEGQVVSLPPATQREPDPDPEIPAHVRPTDVEPSQGSSGYVFKFGKHKGKALEHPSIPMGYLEWLIPLTAQKADDPSNKYQAQSAKDLALFTAELARRREAQAAEVDDDDIPF